MKVYLCDGYLSQEGDFTSVAVETCCNESVFIVMFQASALLHKMHTLQLTRKYVKSITPERKAQVGLYMFHYLLNNVLIV